MKYSNTYQSTLNITKTSKIEQLISEGKFEDALELINQNDEYLNQKAIILDRLGRYDESIECFNRLLALNPNDELKIGKASALYKYAKISFFPASEFEKALSLINEAIRILPGSEDSSEYYFLKAEIMESLGDTVEAQKAYLIAYNEKEKLNEFEKQLKFLNDTEDILINITGTHFYNFSPAEGLIADLKKEEDNEHDSDAIAVYFEGEKIGYVANSDYTLLKGASSASDIKNKIDDGSKAEILFVFMDRYIVCKIV